MSCTGCKKGIGDWLVSDLSREERESALLDAELQRQQQEQLIKYMGTRAMSSGSTNGDQKKYIILGGLTVLMLAVIILKA